MWFGWNCDPRASHSSPQIPLATIISSRMGTWPSLDQWESGLGLCLELLGKSSGPGTLRRGLELPLHCVPLWRELAWEQGQRRGGQSWEVKKTEMLLMASFELLDPTVSVSPATSQGESLNLALGSLQHTLSSFFTWEQVPSSEQYI